MNPKISKKMKAIHNMKVVVKGIEVVVWIQRYQRKWKQFTTELPDSLLKRLLYESKDIKENESNSQLRTLARQYRDCCMNPKISKKMKAIHNAAFDCKRIISLYESKDIKENESNSQLSNSSWNESICCMNPKISKKMKAIHNHKSSTYPSIGVVWIQRYQRKWKQFTTCE